MDWLNILAGGAAGLGQGLGQVNDLRQQQAQQRLQQQQFEAQQEERKRNAIMQAWQEMQGGQTIEDPAKAQEFSSIGLSLVKGPDGRPMKPKSPQQQQTELLLADREFDLNEKRQEAKYQEEIDNMPPEQWLALPPDTRQIMLNRAGREKVDPLTFEERMRFSEKARVAEIQAQARLYAAMNPRPVNQEVMDLNRKKFEASMRAKAQQAAMTGILQYRKPEEIAAHAEQLYQQYVQENSATPVQSAPGIPKGKGKVVGFRQIG